jgi:hypothetical protein
MTGIAASTMMRVRTEMRVIMRWSDKVMSAAFHALAGWPASQYR